MKRPKIPTDYLHLRLYKRVGGDYLQSAMCVTCGMRWGVQKCEICDGFSERQLSCQRQQFRRRPIRPASTRPWTRPVITGRSWRGVIEHFAAAGDSLKLEAAYYLIGNMEGHCYVTYDLIDTTGETVEFAVTDYPSFDSLLAAFDVMEAGKGTLDFKSRIAADDIATITADYLIENIDLAFTAWREKPWARGLSFEDFCDGVLPYRGSNEPLESWRPALLERYADLASKMKDPTDPIEAAALINEDIMTWFTFDERWYFHPTDQGLAEMQQSGFGRCEDMTNVAIYALRANGIGATSDYTPALGRPR